MLMISWFFSVRCAQSPPLYFAEVLEKALDKSKEKTVTRVMVTRAEVSDNPAMLRRLCNDGNEMYQNV